MSPASSSGLASVRPPMHDRRSMPRRRSSRKASGRSFGASITTGVIHGLDFSASRIASAPLATVIRITRNAGTLNIIPWSSATPWSVATIWTGCRGRSIAARSATSSGRQTERTRPPFAIVREPARIPSTATRDSPS